jgi:hypothetical protein
MEPGFERTGGQVQVVGAGERVVDVDRRAKRVRQNVEAERRSGRKRAA